MSVLQRRLFEVFRVSTGERISDVIIESESMPRIISDNVFVVESVRSPPGDLVSIKEFYKRSIDCFTAQVRERWLSGGTGMEWTYIDRETEARDFKDGGSVGDDTTHPYLYYIASATGYSMNQIANGIISFSDDFRAANAVIESHREKGRKAVDDAADEIAAAAAHSAAINDLDQNQPT